MLKHKNYIIRILGLMALVLILVACRDTQDDNNNVTETPSDNNPVPTEATSENNTLPPELPSENECYRLFYG